MNLNFSANMAGFCRDSYIYSVRSPLLSTYGNLLSMVLATRVEPITYAKNNLLVISFRTCQKFYVATDYSYKSSPYCSLILLAQ